MGGVLAALIRLLKKVLPQPLVRSLLPFYHKAFAVGSALFYGFPARKLVVVGVTGTKGKSTVTEMLYAILQEAGKKAALASTIRFAVGKESQPNLFKMTTPGRGFVQGLMRRARRAGCTHFVVEITSEAVLQSRHLFLDPDGLVVTNIQHEHIERHGSFANYVAAKRDIVRALETSPKKNRVLVANKDVPETRAFLSAHVSRAIGFSREEMKNLQVGEDGVSFIYGNVSFDLPLPGVFNAENTLAAAKMGEALGIPLAVSSAALKKVSRVPGRAERIDEGQDFLVVVDYAHTPDSLRALYGAFPTRRKICVLGNTGGGRDTGKRPEMGKIADEECAEVILTNEDPYDEDPRAIVEDMARAMKKHPRIIMDRRVAIRTALAHAKKGDAVLISGKGTDPFIMGPGGTKTPWSDAAVVREELAARAAERKSATPDTMRL